MKNFQIFLLIYQTIVDNIKVMGRTNYFNLAEQIYKADPNLTDDEFGHIFSEIVTVKNQPTSQTISTWKSKLRKKGIPIPDERRRK